MSKENKTKFQEITTSCRTFQLGDEPELIHVIKTGFRDKYMVVHEDAYELSLGHIVFGTKEEIEETFDIKL